MRQRKNDRERGPRDGGKKPVRVEHSAGGVVFRRAGKRILVGLVMDSYRKWTFPKGHVEANETPAQAAVRETAEEMGLRGLRLVKPLGRVSIWFKDRYVHVGETINKHIDYFLMEAAPNDRGRAENKKTGERVRALRWVPHRRVAKAASYKNIQPILRKAVASLDGLAYPLPSRERRG